MWKEQGHFGELASRSTSKTAKDKSNRVTLQASQGETHREQSGLGDMKNHMLCCDSEKDSEKDSGYSDAGSDSVHTDVDDQRSSVSEPHRESSKSSNNSVNAAGHNMPPYEELTPIYVIKNLVVKPSGSEQLLHGPLAWGGGWHSLTNAKIPTQLLLIQQPTMPAPSSSTRIPSYSQAAPQGQVQKRGSRNNQNHGSKNSYLPILNSYPRIAPHPRKESHEGKGATWVEGVKESGSEGHSQSKRVCIEEEKREAVPTNSHLLKPQQQHQKENRVHSHSHYKCREGHSPFPSSSYCPLPSHFYSTNQHKSHRCQQSLGSPSISSSQKPSPPSSSDSPPSSSPPSSSPSSSTSHSPYRLALDSSSSHHRRFLNTAEILNQSGLLAITLRTKELLKQNDTIEREIAQLRQHTHLLCQASYNGCNKGSDSLDKLLLAMTESGCYPNLDLNQLKEHSSSHQQSKTKSEKDKEKDNNMRTTKTHSSPTQVGSSHNMDDGTSPPSPLFAPSPDGDQRGQTDGPLDPMSTSLSVSFPRSVPEQGCRKAIIDKDLSDLTVLPESSMHNNIWTEQYRRASDLFELCKMSV